MAELLAQHDIDDYLLHGGKSSVLARGNQPGSGATGWRVAVRHPLRQSLELEAMSEDDVVSLRGVAAQRLFLLRGGPRLDIADRGAERISELEKPRVGPTIPGSIGD
jgi:hypothetical protein